MNLSAPLYQALAGDSSITAELGLFNGEPAIHTRRPVPVESDYPMIVVSDNVSITDQDGLRSDRPVITRDIMVYGINEDQYRTVESLGYLLREKFHRQKDSIQVDDYHVIDIVANGPMPAPTDDEKQIGRVVSLTIRLHATER